MRVCRAGRSVNQSDGRPTKPSAASRHSVTTTHLKLGSSSSRKTRVQQLSRYSRASGAAGGAAPASTIAPPSPSPCCCYVHRRGTRRLKFDETIHPPIHQPDPPQTNQHNPIHTYLPAPPSRHPSRYPSSRRRLPLLGGPRVRIRHLLAVLLAQRPVRDVDGVLVLVVRLDERREPPRLPREARLEDAKLQGHGGGVDGTMERRCRSGLAGCARSNGWLARGDD